MVKYQIWDRKSKINGRLPKQILDELKHNDILKYNNEPIYIIIDEDTSKVVSIQTAGLCPYFAETFEESARLDCEARNLALTKQKEQEQLNKEKGGE